jgi:hypothetical protein
LRKFQNMTLRRTFGLKRGDGEKERGSNRRMEKIA